MKNKFFSTVSTRLAIIGVLFFAGIITTLAAWPITPDGEQLGGWLGEVFDIDASSSIKLIINGSAEADSFLYTSDKKLKTNIKTLPDALDKIMQLRGVTFDWKENGESKVGLIAQEVEEVFPEMVSTDKNTGLKAVEYGNLVAPLIEAIKAQQVEIEALRAEIERLK